MYGSGTGQSEIPTIKLTHNTSSTTGLFSGVASRQLISGGGISN